MSFRFLTLFCIWVAMAPVTLQVPLKKYADTRSGEMLLLSAGH